MFEHRHQPLITRAAFVIRMLWHAGVAIGVILVSLGVGAAGYRWTEGWSWLDSTLNASMILGGMGPVNQLQTTAGKVFATIYALFSGIIFLGVVAILFTPLYHRFIHRFHLEFYEGKEQALEK